MSLVMLPVIGLGLGLALALCGHQCSDLVIIYD